MKKSVVFFSRYPTSEQERDGYFQRVLEIDNLLIKLRRYYIEFNTSVSGYPKMELLRSETYRIKINHKKLLHWVYLTSLCIRAMRVYSHSVLNLSNRLALFIFALPSVKKVLDLHGVVPEEFRLYDDYLSAQYHDEFEEHAIHHADLVIVVSDSMAQHLREKYTAKKLNTITLPVFSTFKDETGEHFALYDAESPTAIYAGGTQKWQQIDLMVRTICKTFQKVKYSIFVPETDLLQALIKKEMGESAAQAATIPVMSVSKNLLPRYYKQANFGFVLREDITVNKVACPTKIIEYLQFGIIPIVNSNNIGDFHTLGMAVITLQDLLQSKFPTSDNFIRMQKENFKIIDRLIALSKSSSQKLQNFMS